MRDIRELMYMQSLPLKDKIELTRQRIQGWYEHWNGEVFISFSGGKDSTVLLKLVRELYPSVEAVFVDTGLEYTQIRQFVKTFDNVTILRPKMRFDEVVCKYGYPLISKEVAHNIALSKAALAKGKTNMRYYKRLLGEDVDSDGNPSAYNCKKYLPLLYEDFNVSDTCCSIMKKNPSHSYSKQTGKKAITAQMAVESKLRTQKWREHGCNAFDTKNPTSNPMIFWTEQDVLEYIYIYNVPICSVYGEVVHDDEQLNLDGEWETKYHTTGAKRTGCVFCGFGAHFDKQKGDKTRFELLKEIDRKKYDYCFSGGEYVDGIWKPNKNGLGMQYVYERLNDIYGEDFVKWK